MIVRSEALGARNAHDAARALLAQMYRETVGEEMPEIIRTERGKPYFSRGNLHFSISHTKKTVFCVLSESPVGIDAEQLDRPISPLLANKILSPSEKAQFDAAADPHRALLTFWVLKEAAAKCSGEGLRGYPNGTHFSLDDPRVSERDGCLVALIQA